MASNTNPASFGMCIFLLARTLWLNKFNRSGFKAGCWTALSASPHMLLVGTRGWGVYTAVRHSQPFSSGKHRHVGMLANRVYKSSTGF